MVRGEGSLYTGADGANALNVSVIIRAYTEDRWDYLVRCIESVQRQTVAPAEIILVIDHNDALLKRAQAELPGIIIVDNPYPPGASATGNAGVEAATSAIAAFIDDDAYASPTWLETLTAEYRSEIIAGVGGRIDPLWLGSRPAWFPDEFGWVVGYSYRGLPDKLSPVRNLIGCNMSFRRQLLMDIGLFNVRIGHVAGKPIGCDETELCIRLHHRLTEMDLLYQPNAVVYHAVPAARATWRYFTARCAFEGRSKAKLSRLFGANASLASEREYVLKVLPLAVLRGIADGLFRLDLNGFRRAGAVIAGVGLTAMSYGWEQVSYAASGRSDRSLIAARGS